MRHATYAGMLRSGASGSILILALCAATGAQAAVTISSAATANMTCSGGVCAPTATKAVLNVGDLETLLASGNVTVTTTGTGIQASDIDVKAALSWSSSGALSLLANKSIAIDNPVSITGLSGLTIGTGKSGAFSFGSKGNVTFANVSSQLAINGSAYTLVGNIKTLASDIAANPGGSFALASNYDASGDGTYFSSAIPTVFTGTFTGLGNTISNLSVISENQVNAGNGLFAEVGDKGVLENIGLINANIVAKQKVKNAGAGALAGGNSGTIMFAYATGSVTVGKKSVGGGLVGGSSGTIANSYAVVAVTGKAADIGGLVGYNFGVIENSHAAGKMTGGGSPSIVGVMGGLVADNSGTISNCYATGAIADKGNATYAGGLVGVHEGGLIENSYATGSVRGSNGGGVPYVSYLGGLVGRNYSTISFSYSTGAVSGNTESYIGGLIGYDQSPSGSLTDTYWDTDMSGITNLNQGAGNIADDPGITGLTTVQFQSGLPAGFDLKIWAESAKIDDGFPYLLANPPAKK